MFLVWRQPMSKWIQNDCSRCDGKLKFRTVNLKKTLESVHFRLQEMDLSVGTYIIDNTKKMEEWVDAIHCSLPGGRTHFNVVSWLCILLVKNEKHLYSYGNDIEPCRCDQCVSSASSSSCFSPSAARFESAMSMWSMSPRAFQSLPQNSETKAELRFRWRWTTLGCVLLMLTSPLATTSWSGGIRTFGTSTTTWCSIQEVSRKDS